MKTMLTLAVILLSLPAMAAHVTTYAPSWGGRDLATQARLLDDAAQQLYHDLHHGSRRSDVVSRARDLARATQDFRRLAERRAAYSQLAHAFRHVEQREEALARRLYDSRGYDGHGRPSASLRQVHNAMHRVDYALQRYAFDGRDRRYGGSFVYMPRYDFQYGYGFNYGYGARHDYRYGTPTPRHDNRRQDQRGDQRHDQQDHRRDERRDDRRDERRDGERQDQQQDRPAEHREERRDNHERARHEDDGNPARRQREPDMQVNEP